MTEPPNRPNAEWQSEIYKAAINPFAPESAEVMRDPSRGRTQLSSTFFGCIVIAVVLIGAIIALGGFAGWLGIITLVPAAIRVPLLQRRISQADPTTELPSSVLLLFTSWAWMFAFLLVASIAFMAICIPAALMSSGMRETGQYVVWITSGLAGFLLFCGLFIASLRLPI